MRLYTCAQCKEEKQTVGKTGPIPVKCLPCRSTAVKVCIDCKLVFDKPNASRRRTCVECRQKRDKIRTKKTQKSTNKRAKEKRAELAKIRQEEKPWLKEKDRQKQQKLRRQLDPVRKMQIRLQKYRRKKAVAINNIERKVRESYTGKKNRVKTLKYLGYTVAELRKHLERQFTEGMTWEKMLSNEIHLDHRLPLSMFDLSNEEELLFAWSLPNLQPLWAADNWAKGNKRLYLI